MKNKNWTWRLFFAGLVLLIIGGIGFAFTFQSGNMFENGEAYSKTFTLTNDTVKNITVDTTHDSNILFKESQNGKNYVEVSGHYSNNEIKQIKSTEVQNDGTTLNLEVKNKGSFFNVMKIYAYGKQNVTIYLNNDSALDELTIHGNSADTLVSDGKVKNLAVSASSGEIQLERMTSNGTKVTNESGDVRLTDLKGSTTVTSSSGEIETTRLKGNLTIESSSGDISTENISGEEIKLANNSGEIQANLLSAKQISFESNSGDIEGSRLDGKVHANSSSGTIDLEDLMNDSSAKTSSGDIDLTFSQAPKTVDATSNSGEVKIELPSGTKAIYNVRSDSGSVKIPNNSKNASSEINAVTSSGDIKVSH
ncbi:DUF4097 family beta strand repeat-containing protein [Listeria fleischmannii]|uniref:DUF4097 family beta strand repeat-containing protein n=1 Tax=Listeria fleischmannii TaxID=1069827 RepID=UPI000254F63B|nr:DUF4097 family beta strand repeat-containing protein [Listeria fleischmannii]EIA20749.1 secreted protein [Listeria fleischmannii subsp. coloradonensis]STY34467.1 Uncharacterised protein [Listeria fleischmannii subsp. coloradonensis]